MKPFQGYGHFCTKCGHGPTFHTGKSGAPVMATYPLRYPKATACTLPDCGCRYYYESGDA